MNIRPLAALGALACALLSSTPALADVAPDPPSVTITSPVDGATFDGPTATFDVTLDAVEGGGGRCAVVDGGRLGGGGVMILLGLICLGLAWRRRPALS